MTVEVPITTTTVREKVIIEGMKITTRNIGASKRIMIVVNAITTTGLQGIKTEIGTMRIETIEDLAMNRYVLFLIFRLNLPFSLQNL